MKYIVDRLILLGLSSVLFLGIIVAFELRIFTIRGTSMFPALYDGDRVVSINDVFFESTTIDRRDVVIVNNKSRDLKLIKRVIGIPGDHVKIMGGVLFVNGKEFKEYNIVFELESDQYHDIRLEANQYFVLGDNRSASMDSRHFGTLTREDIEGKVIIRCRSLTNI